MRRAPGSGLAGSSGRWPGSQRWALLVVLAVPTPLLAAALEPAAVDHAVPAELVIGERQAAESLPTLTVPEESFELRSRLESRALVDMQMLPEGEDVLETWHAGALRLAYARATTLRAVMEARLRWGVAATRQADLLGGSAGAQGYRSNASVDLREAYLSYADGNGHVAFGEQIFVWGKNELFAGADILNPMDVRYDPTAAFMRPKDARAPVLAVAATYLAGGWQSQVVIAPVFRRHRGFLWGRDFAVAAPESELAQRLAPLGAIDASIRDALQEGVQSTQEPRVVPQDFTWALRESAQLSGWDLALTAVAGWDRTPRMRIDPDLWSLVERAPAWQVNTDLLLTDPELNQATSALRSKLAMGEPLVSSRYRRMVRLAAEAEGVVADTVVRLDVGFSPAQTFYTQGLLPVTRPSLNAVLGAERSSGDTWYAALAVHSVTVLHPPTWDRLWLIERAHLDERKGGQAVLWGVHGQVRYRDEEQGLRVTLAGLYDIAPGDVMITSDVALDRFAPHQLAIGAVAMGGPPGTTGELFHANNLVYASYAIQW